MIHLALFFCLFAQDPSLTLEQIITKGEFNTQGFGPIRWMEDGSGYLLLEKNGDLALFDPEQDSKRILVKSSDLDGLRISSYEFSPDGEKLLIFTNTKRVWRRHTRGDYWVFDLKTKEKFQVGKDAPPSTLMFAKFSPDGTRIAYVCKNNIYMEELKDHKKTQLTMDGSDTIINGTFDWVYEEEFQLRDGFRWSPDSNKIAFWRLDSQGVGTYYMLNTTDGLYSKPIPVQYPKVGTTNSACKIGVIHLKENKTRWFQVKGDNRNHYIARMEWAANSKEVVFQKVNRLQNCVQVMLGDTDTGGVKPILKEMDEAWVDIGDDLKWLNNGEEFTWVSERDGWRKLYVVSRSGKKMRPVTQGDYDVIQVISIDDRNGWVYFIASPDNAAQRFLFRAPLFESGEAERLTPRDARGVHRYQISHDSKWAVHTWSSFGVPPKIELIRLPGHFAIKSFVDNKKVNDRLKKTPRGKSQFFKADIGDKIQLDGWRILPPDFDPKKKYPLLIYVYGEPAAQTVMDRWGGTYYLWHLMLAQQGYVIMSVDNRGTPAPKGRAWRKCVYGQIGILAAIEQAKALKAILKTCPYADPERVGIWGWSGGGSMSLNAIFRYPELYKTAMAIAFVCNQRYYDTIYQERYMGLPDQNPEGFKQGSPITHASNLEGNLLIVYGTGDDNCHYQNAEALINELVAHNKTFTMMSYPNRSHGIHEGKNTTRHLFELLTRYLHQHLPQN